MFFVNEFNQFKKLIHNSIKYPDKIHSFIHNKGNAKLGDSLVNFIYSISKSRVLKDSTGSKVPDFVLAESYRQSKWKKYNRIKLTGNKGRIADRVEALILYFWIKEEFSFEFFIECLTDHLNEEKLHHPREEKINAVDAFKILLDNLYDKYEQNSES